MIMLVVIGSMTANAQGIRFGIKAGPNFSNVDAEDVSTESITNFHAGAFVELSLLPVFAIQPELLYSSQGAKVDGADDFKLDYVSVPVMAKFYILPDLLSIEAGPQFSFLINEDVEETFETKSFDFAVAGGIGFNITDKFIAQARYVVGLTDTTEDAEVTNKVIQLSVGYRF